MSIVPSVEPQYEVGYYVRVADDISTKDSDAIDLFHHYYHEEYNKLLENGFNIDNRFLIRDLYIKKLSSIAKRLKEIRMQNELSQIDIARELNVTQAAITQYEMVKNMPFPDILYRYAERFDVSLDYIFGRSDKPNGSATYDFAKPGTDANRLLR